MGWILYLYFWIFSETTDIDSDENNDEDEEETTTTVKVQVIMAVRLRMADGRLENEDWKMLLFVSDSVHRIQHEPCQKFWTSPRIREMGRSLGE